MDEQNSHIADGALLELREAIAQLNEVTEIYDHILQDIRWDIVEKINESQDNIRETIENARFQNSSQTYTVTLCGPISYLEVLYVAFLLLTVYSNEFVQFLVAPKG